MSISNISSQQLRKAADLQDKIEELVAELAEILSSGPSKATPKAVKEPKAAKTTKAPKAKGGMSAEGRARVAAAQKARWAKINAAKGKAEVKSVKPAKRTMSAAAKAKIGAAAKARWAAKRAEKKTGNTPF